MNPPIWNAPFSDVASRLALVLSHSLWQASLLAIMLWLVLRLLGAGRSMLRYRLSVMALTMAATMPAVTWSFLGGAGPMGNVGTRGATAARAAVTVNAAFPPPRTAPPSVSRAGRADVRPAGVAAAPRFAAWSTTLVLVWFAGVLVMLSRVLLCVRATRRLAVSAKPLDAPLVQNLVEDLRQRLGLLRSVRVKVCEAVSVPAVLGAVWPVLLVPPAFVAGLPVEELRVILAHELAHVRRYDYLVNLGQLVVEAFLFFNPAVWWISRRIRIERESCCDALAARLTGEPLTVARALVACARSACTPPAAADRPGIGDIWHGRAAVQSYGGDGRRGTLWERVRRLVVPDEIPRVRLPWYTLAGLLIGGCAVLFGLERGSEYVVEVAGEHVAQVAAKLLSPKQRVEKLAQIEKEYEQPAGERRTIEKPAGEKPAPKFRIAGTVRMADGSPPPEDTYSGALVIKPHSMGTGNLRLDANGRFSEELSGVVWVVVRPPNMATTYAGPFTAADGDVENLDLLLDRGFSTRIRFINEAGEGVRGVTLENIIYNFRGDGGERLGQRHPQSGRRLESDDDGYVTLDDCSHWPSTIDVRGPGYQFEQEEHQLQPDETLVWKLQPARPTTGTVLDDATGEPIAGAEFFVAERAGYASSGLRECRNPNSGPPRIAISDGEGRFRLNSLHDDAHCAILVLAENHGLRMLHGIRAGRRDLEVRLGPALYVKGEIKGNLDRLQRDRKTNTPYFNYRDSVKLESGGYGSLLRADVLVENGVGRFTVADLFPGPVTLEFPDRNVSLDLTVAIDDYEIDLDQPATSDATFKNLPQRTISLRFDLPPDAPLPRGQLRAGFQLPNSRDLDGFREQYLDVTQNEVRFEVPVGSRLFYNGDKLVGYWIENRSDIEVPAGDGPLEIIVAALPAGGIYGRVFDWTGNPAKNCKVHLLTADEATQRRLPSMNSVEVHDAEGRFILGRLPLGGRYRVLAADQDSAALALSEIIAINVWHPLEEIELRFVEGVTLAGEVLGPGGRPVAGAALRFEYRVPRFSSNGPREPADADGRFRVEHINPRPGQYLLQVVPGAKLCGTTMRISDFTHPLTMHVERGKKLQGVMIDAATRRPLSEILVSALPDDYSRVRYQMSVQTRADADGRFQFDNLEAADCSIYVAGASKMRIVGAEPRGDKAIVRAGRDTSVTVAATLAKRPSLNGD